MFELSILSWTFVTGVVIWTVLVSRVSAFIVRMATSLSVPGVERARGLSVLISVEFFVRAALGAFC